uniref:CKLF like MARVEL transmembrane domain containing 1 n=2 Tax=Propithecus coquereli TaxID=379532 RepID=A0A2K6EJD3_PROCO
MEPKDTKREFAKTLPANLQPEPPTPPAPSTISVSDAPPPQAKGSVRAVRVALPKKSVQSRRPKPSAQSLSKSSKEGMIKKRAKEGTIKKPAEELTKKQAEEEIKKYAEEEEVKKRAEGRAKVPQKFRDSLKRFFFSPTGMLKILRMGFIIGALACFIIVEANESYIAITVLEISIVLFFILIYMLTLHHLLTYLHWPLLDLINSIISAVFLLVVAILTMREKERRHLFYVGGTLCLAAAIACVIDAFVVTKWMRNNVKSVLGVKYETKSSPDQVPS